MKLYFVCGWLTQERYDQGGTCDQSIPFLADNDFVAEEMGKKKLEEIAGEPFAVVEVS